MASAPPYLTCTNLKGPMVTAADGATRHGNALAALAHWQLATARALAQAAYLVCTLILTSQPGCPRGPSWLGPSAHTSLPS